jgi:ribosomal protein L32
VFRGDHGQTSSDIIYVYNDETHSNYDIGSLTIADHKYSKDNADPCDAGHTWGTEYTVDQAATCLEEGSESIHCTVCGEIDESTVRVIPKADHAYGDWTVVKKATCTEAGSREKVCANCGDKITEETPATGHAYGDWIVVKEATEDEEGLERRTCSNDTSHVEERTIPRLAHVHDLTKTEAKAATCTEDGNAEYWTCSKCGKIYSDAEGMTEISLEATVIHALGHTWGTEYTVDKEATCTEEGSESIHCSVCGESDPTTARAIPKTEHAYGAWTVVKEATCMEAGSREKVCTNCGDKIIEEIPATGHAYSDWTVVKEPTCTEVGSREKVCANCGDKITEEIHATGHAYGDWTVVKEPTCTEVGSREKVCANCDDKITEEIPATGHAWSKWVVVKEATENEEGLERRTCSNDASHVEERAIPKLSHVHDLTKTDAKAATCTEAGNIEYWTCTKCGRVYSDAEGVNEVNSEETVIHALGHSWSTEYTVDKEATCTAEGIESIHCTVCGESDPSTARAIPKAEHAYGDWTVVKKATCTETGSREKVCANCGDKIEEEIPAAHQWNENYTVDVAQTYTEEGVESIHCSVCGEIKAGSERAIAKLKKIPNTITAKNVTRTYSTKAQYFGLGVKVKYGTPTYKSSTKSVLVSKAGRVTVKAKFIGRATITITSPKSTKYTAATKKITITVNPTKTTLSSVTSPSKGKMTVKWKKNAVGTGYLFQYSTSSKFTKPKTVTIKKNTILSKTIGSLVRGKKYYVRIRTYKTVGGVKFYSGWSAVKAVTVKK